MGCTLNCRFCHTGTQKLVRNLTPAEILGQLLIAKDALDDWPSTAPGRKVTNIVMMGMGEPLYNFDNVKAALAIVIDGDALALSQAPRDLVDRRRGADDRARRGRDRLRPGDFAACGARRIRDEIVPINKKYPIAELLEACRTYPGASNARRITFEYVMLKGVNDSLADARALVKLVAGIPAKINLIPFNPWPGAPYECSDWARSRNSPRSSTRPAMPRPVRTPRGRDIMAACGQLKSESVKERASARLARRKAGSSHAAVPGRTDCGPGMRAVWRRLDFRAAPGDIAYPVEHGGFYFPSYCLDQWSCRFSGQALRRIS